MDTCRPCGCKGRRTCLICEKEFGIEYKTLEFNKDEFKSYVYCPYCNKAWSGWDIDSYQSHPNHKGEPIEFPGVYIDLNFLTVEQEECLLDGIESLPWDVSQSGRRKQNFGPRCNFKKRKIRLGDFNGFPKFSAFVQEKFIGVDILKTFKTIEQCTLEYDPKRGASIDPHIDDCWIWGERIVTVNLLSDSVLTMTRNTKFDKYNLDCVKAYKSVLDQSGNYNTTDDIYEVDKSIYDDTILVRIPMPKRSLLVLYNSARYDWEHQVLREDITTRRVCLAYREFTPPYLEKGCEYDLGRLILQNACNFW